MPLNLEVAFAEYTKYLFKMIRDHSDYLLNAFKPHIEEIEKRSMNADEEYMEYLAEQISELNDFKDETIPLLLIKTYSAVEKMTYNLVSRLSKDPNKKKIRTMQDAARFLEKEGIIWSVLNGAQEVETTRLLVNCYKHNDSKISSSDLSGRLSQPEGEKIDWESVNLKDIIDSSESFVIDLRKHVFCRLTTG